MSSKIYSQKEPCCFYSGKCPIHFSWFSWLFSNVIYLFAHLSPISEILRFIVWQESSQREFDLFLQSLFLTLLPKNCHHLQKFTMPWRLWLWFCAKPELEIIILSPEGLNFKYRDLACAGETVCNLDGPSTHIKTPFVFPNAQQSTVLRVAHLSNCVFLAFWMERPGHCYLQPKKGWSGWPLHCQECIF